MNDDVNRVLSKARKLIEIGWTRGANARDGRGVMLTIDDPRATCFCLHGAVCRATHELQLSDEVTYAAMTRLDNLTPNGLSAVAYNDGASSKRPILDLIDKALAP